MEDVEPFGARRDGSNGDEDCQRAGEQGHTRRASPLVRGEQQAMEREGEEHERDDAECELIHREVPQRPLHQPDWIEERLDDAADPCTGRRRARCEGEQH